MLPNTVYYFLKVTKTQYRTKSLGEFMEYDLQSVKLFYLLKISHPVVYIDSLFGGCYYMQNNNFK